jgi:hypothetical protein
MNKKNMIDLFGYSSSTINAWAKGEQGEQRKLLYEVLASLPIEYVKERAKMSNIDLDKLKNKEQKK